MGAIEVEHFYKLPQLQIAILCVTLCSYKFNKLGLAILQVIGWAKKLNTFASLFELEFNEPGASPKRISSLKVIYHRSSKSTYYEICISISVIYITFHLPPLN